jgi:GTP-binding protein EngB required for normal cell division
MLNYFESNTTTTNMGNTASYFAKKAELNILLVGQTGAGKTSLFNYLTNAMKGNKPSKYEYFHVAKNEEATKDLTKSQTQAAHLYDFSLPSLHISFIDTPGLGDTRGLKQDEKNVQSIIDKLQELKTLDGVVIIANGTMAREDVNLKYVIESLKGIFPKSITDNIMLLLTNCTPTTANFNSTKLLGFTPKETFYLQNPFSVWDNNRQKILEGDPKLRDKIMKEIDKYHNDAAETFDELCQALSKVKKVPTNSFVELYDKKTNVEARIIEAMTIISDVKNQEKKLESIKDEIAAGSQTAELYKEWEMTVKSEANVQENTKEYNTLCGQCTSNCHLGCSLDFSVNKEVFKTCRGIHGENCRTCGHSYVHHFHGYKKWIKTIILEKKIDEDAKSKHEEALNKVTYKEKQLAKIKAQIKQLNAKVQEQRSLIQTLIDEYAGLSFGSSMELHIKNMIDLVVLRIKGEKNEEVRKILQQDKQTLENKWDAIKKSLQK